MISMRFILKIPQNKKSPSLTLPAGCKLRPIGVDVNGKYGFSCETQISFKVIQKALRDKFVICEIGLYK